MSRGRTCEKFPVSKEKVPLAEMNLTQSLDDGHVSEATSL